jgi:hypothetical protein
MPQIFSASANTWFRLVLFSAPLVLSGIGYAAYLITWSPYYTDVRRAVDQPVPFSHKHHAAQLGIDCRYCHDAGETSAYAGMPSTHTCMTCHSQIWTEAPVLAPVRQSLAESKPLEWQRVHKLPNFVYFNHSIHVSKGVGCSSCHGNVGEMPITWKDQTLYMQWCISCHRHPSEFIRPKAEIFNLTWQPSPNQKRSDDDLVRPAGIKSATQIMDCTTCHH